MESFKDKVASAETLIEKIDLGLSANNMNESQVQKAIEEFVVGDALLIRAFLAALSTSKMELSKTFLEAFKDVVKNNEEERAFHVLLIKNIIMSSNMARKHEGNNDANMAEGSRSVTSRCHLLLFYLQGEGQLPDIIRVNQAIDLFEQGDASIPEQDAAQIRFWHKFFEEWKFAKEDLKLAQKHLLQER